MTPFSALDSGSKGDPRSSAAGPRTCDAHRATMAVVKQQPSRYELVPRVGRVGPSGVRVRRYSLARVAPSPRSALGEDRHERLERAASFRSA